MTSQPVMTETWCCTDCLYLLANGDTPPEMNEDQTEAWLATVTDEEVTLGRHTDLCGCEDWDTDQHREGCEHDEFSWDPCDTCGSRLGGERHAVTFWTDDVEEIAR